MAARGISVVNPRTEPALHIDDRAAHATPAPHIDDGAARAKAMGGAQSMGGAQAMGGVRVTQRFEGLLLLAAAIVAYFHLGFSGGVFAVLFLVPDLSLLGYLKGPRVGAIVYNLVHSTVGPLALAMVSLLALPALLPYALIWLAHIGMDRALGYGLKYAAGFRYTHLGLVGRR